MVTFGPWTAFLLYNFPRLTRPPFVPSPVQLIAGLGSLQRDAGQRIYERQKLFQGVCDVTI